MSKKSGKSSGGWFGIKFVVSIILLIAWGIYAVRTRWASRISLMALSKFVGIVAFQYNRGFRQAFTSDFDLRDPPPVSPPTNTRRSKDKHKQASVEDMVNYSIDEFLARQRKTPYNITKSVCNEVAQRLAYYIHEYKEDIIKDNACFKMINTDYFADMEYWLTFMKPLVIYTFVPEGVGGVLSNGTYSCKDDIFTVVKDDGKFYDHLIWDYGYEYVTIETCWGVVICPIDQFRIPEEPNYRVISIVPATFVPVPFSTLVKRRRFDRLRVSYDAENILRIMDSFGREFLSMSTPGSSVDYTVPSDLFDILVIKFEHARHMTIRSIEKFLKKEGVSKEYISGALIYEILKKKSYPPTGWVPRILSCEDATYQNSKPEIKKRPPKFVLRHGPPRQKSCADKLIPCISK